MKNDFDRFSKPGPMSKGKLIPLVKSRGTPTDNDEVLDAGTIGKLKYEVSKKGNIRIYERNRCFKKDADLFEDSLNKLDFDSMEDGDRLTIEGNGDNDDLVFTKKEGEIQLTLSPKGFGVINKLREIIGKGRRGSV